MNLTRWRTAGLLAGALIVGTIIGPPLAQAATAGLARIEGGGSANVAKVAGTGQLQVAQADPKSLVARFSAEDCHKGGVYKIPAGKALIVTAVTFFNGSTSPSTLHSLDLTAGPPSDPCAIKPSSVLAAQITADVAQADTQTFPTGIAVPAGDAIGLFSVDGAGAAEIYGYLVPASAVPHNVLSGATSVDASWKLEEHRLGRNETIPRSHITFESWACGDKPVVCGSGPGFPGRWVAGAGLAAWRAAVSGTVAFLVSLEQHRRGNGAAQSESLGHRRPDATPAL